MRPVSGELGYQLLRLEVTAVATLACATVTLFTFVDHATPYPVTMFLPPIGAVYAYLVLRGPRGAPAAGAALLLGNAITLPRQFAAAPLAEFAEAALLAAVLALGAYPPHRAWRRRRGDTPAFGLLTLFVLAGLLGAPLAAAAGTYGLSRLLGPPLRTIDLARMTLGVATAIAAIAPACLLAAVLMLGRSPKILAARLDRPREALLPASVILLAPVLALALPDAGLAELWLLPLAALPLIWISFTGDLIRAAIALAAGALGVGMLAVRLYGEAPQLYRTQVMVLCCSLATLYVAAAYVTEAANRRQEEAATTRWQALLAAAPAMVAWIAADGTWRTEDGPDEGPPAIATEQLLPAPERRELAAAIQDRHPRTLRWQSSREEPRNFVTQVTPLPDGETLVVTTETTLADAAEATLAWERTHDRETGLPSRDLFLATAERTRRAGTPAFLLVVDLDYVTRRALLLGVDGPAVLRSLAQRISAVFGEGGSLVARTGDDQLAVLVPEQSQIEPGTGLRLLEAVSTPVDLNVGRVTVQGSAGLASLEGPGGAREALRRASVAAQTSGERGEARIVVSDGLAIRTASERARLVGEVVAAVERAELEVVYQPDVDPAGGRLQGMEALVRWRRRDGYAVSTEDFVRMAEEAGAVVPIDDWVMRESLAQLGRWRRELGIGDVELGINVSALSLTDDLPGRLAAECRHHDVPPGLIRLEVTETALGDDSKAVAVLRRARELGFRIALDDFGTGYASLSRLRTLPVDVIKLDRSFLASITEDPATQTLVGMILGLAEPLQVDVVVEGVETQAQRDVLVELGCQRAQGFLFSRPAGVGAIQDLLLGGLAAAGTGE